MHILDIRSSGGFSIKVGFFFFLSCMRAVLGDRKAGSCKNDGEERTLSLVACSTLNLDSVFKDFPMRKISPVSVEFGAQVGGFISSTKLALVQIKLKEMKARRRK